MTHPRTAVRGNLLGAAGMAAGGDWSRCDKLQRCDIDGYVLMIVGIGMVIGAAIGAVLADPHSNDGDAANGGLFNGLGGAARSGRRRRRAVSPAQNAESKMSARGASFATAAGRA